MSESQFLEKLYDLIGEYTYNNPQYEDINDGQFIKYLNGKGFCVAVQINKTNKL